MSYDEVTNGDWGKQSDYSRERWKDYSQQRETVRKLTAALLPFAARPLLQAKEGNFELVKDWYSPGVNTSVAKDLRDLFFSARGCLIQARKPFYINPAPMSTAHQTLRDAAWMKLSKAFRDWRPNKWAHVTFIPVMRMANQKAYIEGGNLFLELSAANIMRRKATGVPWVVTDRFVLTFDGCMEKARMPDKDWVIPCEYIDEKLQLKIGYLAYQSGFYGCAVREFDATKAARMKAARMKAVQHVTVKVTKQEKKNG